MDIGMLIVLVLIVVAVAAPLICLSTLPPLDHDDPRGVPIPNDPNRLIAEDLGVEEADLEADEGSDSREP